MQNIDVWKKKKEIKGGGRDMKIILFFLMLFLVGCGSAGDVTIKEQPPAAEEVEITGNIYNDAAPPAAFLFGGIPDRMLPVIQSQPINISTSIKNITLQTYLNLKYKIEIEDTSFTVQEHWTCNLHYPDKNNPGSFYGFEVWTVYSQPLPACEGDPKDSLFVCADFPYLDCAQPSYRIDYSPYREGIFAAEGSINSLNAGEIFLNVTGYGNTGIDIRPNHKARWTVLTEAGMMLAQREYLFDVNP